VIAAVTCLYRSIISSLWHIKTNNVNPIDLPYLIPLIQRYAINWPVPDPVTGRCYFDRSIDEINLGETAANKQTKKFLDKLQAHQTRQRVRVPIEM
jgi:hypothetical protein